MPRSRLRIARYSRQMLGIATKIGFLDMVPTKRISAILSSFIHSPSKSSSCFALFKNKRSHSQLTKALIDPLLPRSKTLIRLPPTTKPILQAQQHLYSRSIVMAHRKQFPQSLAHEHTVSYLHCSTCDVSGLLHHGVRCSLPAGPTTNREPIHARGRNHVLAKIFVASAPILATHA